MRAPRFYVEEALRAGAACRLPAEAAHHAVRVLRVRRGDPVMLFDGQGGEYEARIAAIERHQVHVEVIEHHAVERESPLRVALIQGVSSGERMDFTVRKAVELGVAEIRPVLAAGSVARPKGERAAARVEHWQKVAIAACEQCGRNRVPRILPLAEISNALQAMEGLKLLLSPSAPTSLTRACRAPGDSVIIAAGPEAGFTEAEERLFIGAGFVPASLGPRILRTETAALAALAALNALRGDF